MRDVRNFSSSYTRQNQVWQWWIPAWSAPNTFTSTGETLQTERADVTPTVPNKDGVYYLATPYSAFHGIVSTEPGEVVVRNKITGDYFRAVWTGKEDHGYINYGCLGHVPNIPASVVSRARSRAIEQVKANNLDLGVSLGETRESVRTVVQVTQEALRLLKNPLRLLRLGRLKEASQAYLTVQYGIKPLVSDAYAACQIIQNGLAAPTGRVKVVQMDDSYTLPDMSSTLTSYPRRASGKVERGVEVSYTFGVMNPESFEIWRYGITNPFAIAWELTSLSFVIDWFTGIGSFIRGLQQPIGLQVLTGYETWFLRNSMRIEWSAYDVNHTLYTGDMWMKTHHTTRAHRRTPTYIFNIPLPYLDLGVSESQVASIVALLATRSR